MAAKAVRDMNEAERENFHRDAEARMQTFKYDIAASGESVKGIVRLSKTNLMRTTVQVVRDGGENNMHYHTGADTTWWVLKGRVKFYGIGDEILGEFGENEGICIPGGARYWFEKSSDEPLEIIQMVAYDTQAQEAKRINLDSHKAWMEDRENLKVYE